MQKEYALTCQARTGRVERIVWIGSLSECEAYLAQRDQYQFTHQITEIRYTEARNG